MGNSANGQDRRVAATPPQPGPPAGTLPNLDEMRQVTDEARRNGARRVRAPQPVPSTQRRWRHGQQGQRTAADSKSSAVKANHVRGTSPTVREGFERASRAMRAGMPALPEPQGTSDMAMARIDPRNRTGTGGVDLLSNNFNWSLGLVGLKGRGLDLGLTLSYNSLATWTQSGNYIAFDMDQGDPSPGFRLGFPVVQGPYYNNLASTNFYMLITPSGQHVELRQLGTSDVYQAVDASYSQLTSYNNGSYLIFRAGGAQLTFNPNPLNTEYHCTEVKDRNGNFLTINYNGGDDIWTVTDTLGRTITFNYDGNGNIQSITQPWNGAAHQWATFGWGTTPIGNNFPTMSYAGPLPGTSIPVLTQVGLPDGSYYTFEYNNSYGMVSTIRYFGYDDRPRRYTTYVAPASATDCPRIASRHDWADNWTGLNGVPAEVVTQYAHDGGTCVMTAPDGTIYKETYGSGWQGGLTTGEEFWSGGVKKKWTTTAWTQDNTGVGYLINPRVTQGDIWDSENNHKKTTIDYSNSTYAGYSLPYGVIEYAADGATPMRSTWYDYNLSQQYLDRRIIGLVMWEHVVDHVAGGYAAKTGYGYDEGTINSQATTTTQHDQSYSSSFSARANVTSVSRWDVTDINNANKAHTSQMTYDAAGSVLTSGDPLSHSSSIEYSATYAYAYPTTMHDPDNNQSFVQYNSDTGAVTQTQGPPPAGQSQGIIQTLAYDNAGRVQQVTTTNTGAYTRYVYGPNYVQSFSSVNSVADDAYAIQLFDGAGRVIGAANYHPGSAGGFSMVNTIYDLMGRAVKQSNPTEINGSWVPSGDDASGVFYTQQTYDWKGRPLVTTNTDGTQKYAEYGGCGCAGGAVVTLTDEMGRQQRVTSDPLGRQWKTEVLNWDSSVYSTTENTLNARDQVTQVRQFQGLDTSGVYQDTTMTFDGYGRLQSKHVPEQNSGTATTYTYNNDDTTNSVTDARGASATYGYTNNRHLVTGITYSAPAGVATTPDASFSYDPAGNRISASSSTGSSTYVYDQLSRLTAETYQFSDLSGSYTLNYGYNLGGELTSLSIPFTSQSIGYNYDSTGRLTSMTGSGFTASYTTPWPSWQTYTQPLTSFISDIQYRAWGGRKSTTYGNTVSESTSYNSRLQPSSYTLNNVNYTNTNVGPNTSFTSMSWSYDYYADGRVNHAYDSTWNFWDRSYSYDHAGRLQEADTNRVARGLSWDYWHPDPYKQTSTYDVWNNLKLTGYIYNHGQGDWSTYTNNRRSDSGYDADGNVTYNPGYNNTIDVARQNVGAVSTRLVGDGSTQWPQQPASEITQTYEANGRPAKRTQVTRQDDRDPETGEYYGVSTDTLTSHYLHSSVLGARVVEIDGSGNANVWVYAGGQRITTTAYGNLSFEHHNPVTFSRVTTNAHTSSRAAARDERDPQTGPVPLSNPGGPNSPVSKWNEPLAFIGGDPSDFAPGVTLDGMPVTRSTIAQMVGSGVAEKAPPTTVWANGKWNFVHFNYNSGQYAISVFSHYDYTTVTADGRTSGAWHPVFDEVNLEFVDASFGGQVDRHTWTWKKSACGKLVDNLAEIGQPAPRGFRDRAMQSRGMAMGWAAKNGRYRFGKADKTLGISGFHPYLIAGTQGADVYKHIVGVAGALLIGNHYAAFGLPVTSQQGARPARTGNEVAQAQLDIDRAQENDPKHSEEAYAEVADDLAAMEIGGWMRQSINGTLSQDQLIERTFRRICDR